MNRELTMKNLLFTLAFIMFYFFGLSQYQFKHKQELQCTKVKNQARTGTCWSFATASFIESELIKADKNIDISEMHVVRNIYKDKARNYVMRQGKANFSQGSLAHDLIRMMSKHGIVPEQNYSGLVLGEKAHNHSEMEAGLKGFLDGIMKQKRLSPKWSTAFNSILDVYMGAEPESFIYDGKNYTAKEFGNYLELDPADYISLASFSHHPFYQNFILEIPDNYSNGSFYNVPLEEMVQVIDNALEDGYTVAWDGDVSEKGFSAKEGIAVLPVDPSREDLFTAPGKEEKVTQSLRQEHFESYSTTDDHLMHIVGSANDQKGNRYYIIKNSWGEISPYKGYLYMSEAYLKMKTVGIMVNKNGLPKNIAQKMN
jgi:bleomycin hydrolase